MNEIVPSPHRYRPSAAEIVLSALCMTFVIFVSVNRYAEWGFHPKTYLMIASTMFVAIPLAGGALQSLYGRLILIAMVFCWLGDFTGPFHFLLGAGFFLIGHLFLIGSYAVHGIASRRVWLAVPILLIVSGIIAFQIVPQVNVQEQWFVVSYIAVITVMAILACSARGTITGWMLGCGAVTFYISDLFLALNRYTTYNVNYTYFGYPLYYGACVLFALSVSAHRWERNREILS